MTDKEKRSFFEKMGLYASFLKNLVPSPKFIAQTLNRIKNKITNDCRRAINYVVRASSAFIGYQVKTPLSTAEQCPADEKPLIIKIDSKGKVHHMHGASQYDGVVVDSDGDGKNTTDTGRMRPSDEELEGTYFVLYPSKLGIDSRKLKEAMKKETQKTNDYDYYGNNCIDHILRPLQASGIQVDKGWISTPREMCQWCDKMCQDGRGYALDQKEYEKLLQKMSSQSHLLNRLNQSNESENNSAHLRKRLTRSSVNPVFNNKDLSNAA